MGANTDISIPILSRMKRGNMKLDLSLDYHAHILPGCDHGSDGLATSLKQVEMAASAGVKTICATPHFYPHKESVESFLRRRKKTAGLLLRELPENAPLIQLGAEVLICDEPVSALDVSIQAQIINMLEELQETKNLTYLFIAHDLAVVKHISTRIGVMYLGHLVELADSAELYRNPLHPYTEMLLSAIPIADPDLSATRKRIRLEGEVPSPLNPPSGCPFRTRCPKAYQACRESMPPLREVAPGHFAACHNA